MEITWKGKGLNEVGIYKSKKIIKVDKRYFRPSEVDSLLGDASKAEKKLGWKPKNKFFSTRKRDGQRRFKRSKKIKK